MAPYRAKTGGPLSGENAWSPIRRKRPAPYRENDWTTIGREVTPLGSMPPVQLSPETRRRLDALFVGAAREAAADLLVTQCANNLPFCETSDARSLERIRFAVLKLSNGDLAELGRAVEVAQLDWRDVLVAAGFGNDVRAHEAWFPGGHAA